MRVGVIFPGQGSQTVGMGADVARAYPAAAACFAAAKTLLGYDLLALCEHGPEERLTETRYAQPAIFVANVALARAVGDCARAGRRAPGTRSASTARSRWPARSPSRRR